MHKGSKAQQAMHQAMRPPEGGSCSHEQELSKRQPAAQQHVLATERLTKACPCRHRGTGKSKLCLAECLLHCNMASRQSMHLWDQDSSADTLRLYQVLAQLCCSALA